jgi:hypothetical protein
LSGSFCCSSEDKIGTGWVVTPSMKDISVKWLECTNSLFSTAEIAGARRKMGNKANKETI